MDRAATLKDIARELGISPSTVSRILNGKNQQNKKLVARVQEAAKKLNYQVNTAALGLRTNKTRLIGMIVPYISDEFFSSILAGIESVTEQRGYNLLICQSNESNEKEKKLVKSLIACNVEGILISLSRETNSLEFLDSLKESKRQVVLFDRVLRQNDYPFIPFDDQKAAYEAGEHLIQSGRKSFLYVGLSQNLQNDVERLKGYNAALKDHGLNQCVVRYPESVMETDKVLEKIDLHAFDAIVCYYDLIAAEVIAYLKKIDMRIPEEMAVCGFDNRHICDFISPSLTSVDHSTTKMGQMAAETLFNLLNGDELSLKESDIQTSLVIRESTGL